MEKWNDGFEGVFYNYNVLLPLSRFDSKKYDLKLSRINLAELIREMYDFFLPMA